MHNKQSVSDGPRNSFFFPSHYFATTHNKSCLKHHFGIRWHISLKIVPEGEGVKSDASAFVKVHEILKN